MHTSLECVPCFVRQGLDAARYVTDDAAVHEKLLRFVLAEAAKMDMSQCPPAFAQKIHRVLREQSGVADPYKAVKDKFNVLALSMMPALKRQVTASSDPFAAAVRLAIAGNVIDFGVSGDITSEQATAAIDNVMHEPFAGDIENFKQEVEKAENILYLCDNAGEIVFDKLLLSQLPNGKVTAAVRGKPIINDAVMADAEAAGICDIVPVIDNGTDAPGTILEDCSAEFVGKFTQADLIIAKGQGNFETLSDNHQNICYLFKVKCGVIASHVNLELGTHVLLHSPAGQGYEG